MSIKRKIKKLSVLLTASAVMLSSINVGKPEKGFMKALADTENVSVIQTINQSWDNSATEACENEYLSTIQLTGQSGNHITGETFQAQNLSVVKPEKLTSKYYLSSSAETDVKPGNAAALLTGPEYKLYMEMKKWLVSIAAGKTLSTVFTVKYSDLGLDKLVWTAEEFGVNTLYDGDLYAPALQAMEEYFYIDTDIVFAALMNDCPYEFFWYDKSKGSWEYDFRQPITAKYTGVNVTELIVNDEYRLELYPSDEFAADVYELTEDAIEQGKNALAKAQAIVDEYAELDDLAKIRAYADRICGLTDYNWPAAEGDFDTKNPWQILWVFDEDESTKVVCEGYSKAFKLLFDLSTFQSDISCIIVTGASVFTNQGSGPHMWNVIKMDDGKNYILDVTNYDGDAFLDKDKLFIGANDGGDFEEGYYIIEGSYGMGLNYDKTTRKLYSEDDLIISSEAYAGPVIKPVLLLGDVNFDSVTDIKDLTRLARHVAVIEEITDATALLNANTDGVGEVDIKDLTRLARHVAQIEPFPEEET